MIGNVWEWTQSLWGKDSRAPDFTYPYRPEDGREDLDAGKDVLWVVRGDSWNNNRDNARCAYRNRNHPDNRNNNIGFRVVFMHERKTGQRAKPPLLPRQAVASSFSAACSP